MVSTIQPALRIPAGTWLAGGDLKRTQFPPSLPFTDLWVASRPKCEENEKIYTQIKTENQQISE